MSGFRNVYQSADLVFVGRYYPTREDAANASKDELRREAGTSLFAIATDTSGPTWEDELRGLGRIVGVSAPDASAEVIGDAITSERDTLRNMLRSLEWMGVCYPGGRACPYCNNVRASGHNDTCALSAALSAVKATA